MSMAHATALAAGVGGVIGFPTAARVFGLRVPPDPEAHVIVGPERHIVVPGLRTHRVVVRDDELDVYQGLPITGLLRTAVDCLLWLPAEAGRELAADAFQRRIFNPDDLRDALRAQAQRHGLARAWQVVNDVSGNAHSEGEVRLHKLLRRASIGGWKANVHLHDDAGLIGIVDLLFEEWKLVVEFDGRAFHADASSFQRDRSRQNRLIAAGYRILRFTWDDVVQRPDLVVAQILAMLRPAA
jgi:very-short-patch-repair endonuclease